MSDNGEEKKDVLDYLNDETAETLAEEIVNIFVKKASKENLECEFVIEKGTGQLKSREPNTTFSFDTEPGSVLHSFKKALFSRTIELSEMDMIAGFGQKVSKIISDHYSNSLRDVIRQVIMPGSSPDLMPMDDISVKDIEIGDASSVPVFARSTIKIAKDPGSIVNTEAAVKKLSELQEEESEESE